MKIPQIQSCAKCSSKKLVLHLEDGKPHYGRLVCGQCGGFVTWVSQKMARFLERFDGGDK